MCSQQPRPGVAQTMPIRMDRKDGGATKISKPSGPGKVGNPNTGGGGAGGERESEKGGAGVAVLTKPPETDKVAFWLFLSFVRNQMYYVYYSQVTGADTNRFIFDRN